MFEESDGLSDDFDIWWALRVSVCIFVGSVLFVGLFIH